MKATIYAFRRKITIETEGDRCFIEIMSPYGIDNEMGFAEPQLRELIFALTKARQEMILGEEQKDDIH